MKIKVWNTKYCLTNGITEHDVEHRDGESLVVVPKTDKCGALYLHGEGKDWHRSLDAAVERAEEIRIKKLQSLDKSIKKISAIKFSVS